MTTRSSEQVAARRRAMERVQAQEASRLEALAQGVAGVMDAAGRIAAAEQELESARQVLRDFVDGLVNLGKTAEEIADLSEVDVSAVRAARRPTAPKVRLPSTGPGQVAPAKPKEPTPAAPPATGAATAA